MAPKTKYKYKVESPELIEARAEILKLHESARRQRVQLDEAYVTIKGLREAAATHETALQKLSRWFSG